MKIKVIQINIYGGKYFDELIDFLKQEDPDFITMQEVTVGKFNLYQDKDVGLFELLKEKLGMHGIYHGDIKLIGDPDSMYGNAVFSKLPVVEKNVLVLKDFRPVSFDEAMGNDNSTSEVQNTHLLDAKVNLGGKELRIISWHGAWTAPPKDTEETLRQAKMVCDYLSKINGPFILGGDLNNIIGNKTIDMISGVANNLMIYSGVEATTNRKVHKIRPRGYLIDYIFTSFDIRAISLKVPEITVSDHLPVITELEI